MSRFFDKKILSGTAAMKDKLWLLPFGPDQIHLPTLHSPDSAALIIPAGEIARISFYVVRCESTESHDSI